MAKLEKEIKILNVDVEEMQSKLEKINAKFKGKKEQKIYVYDVPTLYYRYLEIKELLKIDNQLLINTNIIKLKNLINEYKDLANENDIKLIEKEFELNNIEDIFNKSISQIISFLENRIVEESFSKLKINPNKWIRLRESNNEITMTSKHILEKENSTFQNVIETEFNVSNIEEANTFLESIGIAKRSYQEKIRYSYVYEKAEIEIDIWPMLSPYMEIECDDEDLINEIIDKLNLKENRIVSLNTEQLYREIGIDVHSISELKF